MIGVESSVGKHSGLGWRRYEGRERWADNALAGSRRSIGAVKWIRDLDIMMGFELIFVMYCYGPLRFEGFDSIKVLFPQNHVHKR